MKYYTSVLFLFIALNIFGQDTTVQINSSWKNLTTQLKRRTDIVINLGSFLPEFNKNAKKEYSNSKLIAIELVNFIETIKTLDSTSISIVSSKNDKLTQALSRTLVVLESEKKLWKNNDFIDIITQLEGSENRIAVARNDFNETCKSFNRLDFF